MDRIKKGFTLMEMLIVVAIIAVLVAIAIPTFTSSLNLVRETTCAANRRSLKAQLAIEQMMTQAKNYQAVAETDQGKLWLKDFVCPSGGTVSVKENSIICSKHGGTVATVQAKFQDIVDNWKKYSEDMPKEKKYLSNDNFRLCYTQKYGTWPKLEIGGKPYYVQPYYESDSKDVILFAREDTEKNWYTSCIYNTDEGVWYTGKGFSIAGRNWETVKAKMTEAGWKSAPSGEIPS